VCDKCPEPKPNAVASLVLSNGHVTRGALKIDLCVKHKRELERSFKPRSKPGPKPKRQERLGKGEMAKLRERFARLIAKHAKLSNETVREALGLDTRAATRLLREGVANKQLKHEGRSKSSVFTRA